MIWVIIISFMFLIFYSLLYMGSIEERREQYLDNFFKFDNTEDNNEDNDNNKSNNENNIEEG